MSDRQAEPSQGRYHPLLELTKARLLEFVRDPESIFWVFAFPVILAVVLGIAFRDDPSATAQIRTSGPGSRYIDFLIPGLVGLNIMGSCMWGIGYAVVDSRRRKLLKRFAATPMRRSHFLLSFMLSRFVFLAAEVGALVLFGRLVFGVKVNGSIAALGLFAVLGSAAFSGLAVLVAARTDSTEVASGWMNFVQIPMWLFSGSFFDHARFPEFLHPLIRALPLTAINDSLRLIMNQGVSLDHLWVEMLVLAAWSAASFVLAMRIFKWH